MLGSSLQSTHLNGKYPKLKWQTQGASFTHFVCKCGHRIGLHIILKWKACSITSYISIFSPPPASSCVLAYSRPCSLSSNPCRIYRMGHSSRADGDPAGDLTEPSGPRTSSTCGGSTAMPPSTGSGSSCWRWGGSWGSWGLRSWRRSWRSLGKLGRGRPWVVAGEEVSEGAFCLMCFSFCCSCFASHCRSVCQLVWGVQLIFLCQLSSKEVHGRVHHMKDLL